MAALTDPVIPAVPALVTVAGVDILATGTWNLSTGPATFTTEDLAGAVEAAACPSVGAPVLKLGHVDPRFDGEPAVGRVTNMALTASGNKITGDLSGLPGWLAADTGNGSVLASAYPSRSIEGSWGFVCQQGHAHPFVITALALLGVARPGVGVLSSLPDVAELFGIAAADYPGTTWNLNVGGGPMAGLVMAAGITTEDVRRSYYESGVGYAMWITEMQLSPPQLIVADESTSQVFRVPVTIKGSVVTFGDAVEVEVTYVDVAAASAPDPAEAPARVVFASRADSRTGVEDPAPADPPEPAPEPEPEPLVIDAAGSHGAYTGTHSHPHSPMGSQGGDTTHDHSHTHDGSGSHAHAHAAAAGSTTEGAEMDFSDDQMAALRTRLGLADDAELTTDQIMAALAEPVPVAASGNGAMPAGVVAIDQEVWDETQRRIAAGEAARASQLRSERDTAIMAAVQAGKFPVARVKHWEAIWDANPDATRTVLAGLTPGVVPMRDIGQAGGDLAELDEEYARLFPPGYDAAGRN
jgi:hypothetical protein